jgi:signal transduction histidine kinase
MSGVTININPLIQLQESMTRSQDQLESMMSSVPTPVAMFDKNLKYLAYSSRWVHDWSLLGSIQKGGDFASALGSYGKVWELYMKRALNGEKIERAEDLIAVSSKVKIWFRWVCQPWRDADGEVGGVILMAENITERKEAEMKLNQSAKLSALGEMAGGIAHEINNPMSIIKGYIDLIKRQSARQSLSEDVLLKYIDKMDFTVHRISRIVSGMRRFSRESSLDEKQPYSLNKIINETLDFCHERITNFGITLDVEYFKSEALFFCRPVEISQVFLNLINNSFQAISELPHPWIKIICEEYPDHFEIKIVDCGQGIPESSLTKLFQPFFTTKEIGVGTGLGLSISRGIVEEHLGILKYVEKTPHTTFMIELPKSSKVSN